MEAGAEFPNARWCGGRRGLSDRPGQGTRIELGRTRRASAPAGMRMCNRRVCDDGATAAAVGQVSWVSYEVVANRGGARACEVPNPNLGRRWTLFRP